MAVGKSPSQRASEGVEATIEARIADIDRMLSRQLDAILHHEAFQRLEASWRGLHKLVHGTETGDFLKLYVLNAGRNELLQDLRSAFDLSDSFLWKAVYGNFVFFGCDLFGALIGDYEFGMRTEDVELLEHISHVGAVSHVPFISAVSATTFGMESYAEMQSLGWRDVEKTLDERSPANTRWNSLRDSEDSRFIALVLPRVLRRLPYGRKTRKVDAFDYEEEVRGNDDYLWGNAAYDYACCLTAAFAKDHWCVAIRGPEGGGLVANLPMHRLASSEGEGSYKIPTECAIPETLEHQLSTLGFIPLLHCRNTDYAAFFAGNSCQRPKRYDTREATANAHLSALIPYSMATSRIAHYLMAICRDRLPEFQSIGQCEEALNAWLTRYAADDDTASRNLEGRYPLRAAQVKITDDGSRPGYFRAIAHLRFADFPVSLRLVTDLPVSRDSILAARR